MPYTPPRRLTSLGNGSSLEKAANMPVYVWWEQYGASVAELQTFKNVVFAQPSSALLCECIDSELVLIEDRRRNRLGHEKANKLVSLVKTM